MTLPFHPSLHNLEKALHQSGSLKKFSREGGPSEDFVMPVGTEAIVGNCIMLIL